LPRVVDLASWGLHGVGESGGEDGVGGRGGGVVGSVLFKFKLVVLHGREHV